MKPSKITLTALIATLCLAGFAACEPPNPAEQYCYDWQECNPVIFAMEYPSQQACKDHLGPLMTIIEDTATKECNDAYIEFWDCHTLELCGERADCIPEYDAVDVICELN